VLRAVLRRLAAGAVVLWAAATAAYLALLAAPGDTVDSIIGDGADTPLIRSQIIANTSTTSGARRTATSAARTCCNGRSGTSSRRRSGRR